MIIKKCLAELSGTFALVFVGTGIAIVNEITSGSVTQMGIAIAFGLIVFIMILVFGHISGSHINPAVTVALAVNRHFPWKDVTPYIVSQLIGAVLASLVLKTLFVGSKFLGGTNPSGTVLQSFLLETLLSFLLMFTILKVIEKLSAHKITGAAIIGMVVLLEAYFAGPICGASMNPARSFGPAVAINNLGNLWIYITAPIIGMLLAGVAFKLIKKEG